MWHQRNISYNSQVFAPEFLEDCFLLMVSVKRVNFFAGLVLFCVYFGSGRSEDLNIFLFLWNCGHCLTSILLPHQNLIKEIRAKWCFYIYDITFMLETIINKWYIWYNFSTYSVIMCIKMANKWLNIWISILSYRIWITS